MLKIKLTAEKQTIAVCGLNTESEQRLKERLEKEFWTKQDLDFFASQGIKKIERKQVKEVSVLH